MRRSDKTAFDLRRSGIDLLGDIPWGTHFCQFFETGQDIAELLVPYFQAGLEQNECCVWITTEPLDAPEAEAALREAVPDLDRYLSRGQIEIVDCRRWYCEGPFNVEPVLQAWMDKEAWALAHGYDGLRVSGNAFWLTRSDWDEFRTYESIINSTIHQHRMISACSYPIAKCGTYELIEVVGNHPQTLIKRAGKWEIIASEEARRIEAARRETEHRYESLVERSPMAIAVHRGGRFVFVNPAFMRLIGASSAEDLLDTPVLDTVHPEDRSLVAPRFTSLAEAELPDPVLEYRLLRLDGRVMDVIAVGHSITFKGKPAIQEFLQDATEQKKAQRQLEEVSQRLRLHVENSPLGAIEWDGEFRITRWSDGAERMFGWKASEVLGKRFGDFHFIHEDDLDAVDERLGRMLAGQYSRNVGANRNYRKDGSVVYCQWYNSVLRDPEGKLLSVLSLALDMTERTKTEAALQQSEQRQRLLFDALPSAVFGKDLEGRYILLNRKADEWIGKPRTEILGKRDAEVFPTELAQAFAEADRRVLETNRPVETEDAMPLEDGLHTLLSVKFPLLDANGRPYAICGIATDITDRQRAAEAMRQAKEAAEQASRAKSNFLASISHELRTPMTAILGMTELALAESLPPEIRDHLQTAKDSADNLLVLLNELLDLSRIEAGKLSLESTSFSVRAALEQVVQSFEAWTRQKGLRLTWELPSEVPDGLVGDPLRLKQVLSNLIGNAIKFTRTGGVNVRARIESRTPEGIELRFVVTDTGIGIPAEDQSRIFAPFTQADASTTRQHGGTGLGLAIASRLVAMMGGRIWVESEPGRGSSFSFTARFSIGLIPPSAEPLAMASQQSKPPSVPLRILLVEDTPTNQKLVARLLTKRGHTVELAENGRQAVDRVGREQFDLVLMDVAMPEMDGLEATRAIRAMEQTGGRRIPIIAMTAHAMKVDQERCLAAGMDAYLTKPIDSRELFSMVETKGVKAE